MWQFRVGAHFAFRIKRYLAMNYQKKIAADILSLRRYGFPYECARQQIVWQNRLRAKISHWAISITPALTFPLAAVAAAGSVGQDR
jgi:hypothetical protein